MARCNISFLAGHICRRLWLHSLHGSRCTAALCRRSGEQVASAAGRALHGTRQPAPTTSLAASDRTLLAGRIWMRMQLFHQWRLRYHGKSALYFQWFSDFCSDLDLRILNQWDALRVTKERARMNEMREMQICKFITSTLTHANLLAIRFLDTC